MNFELKSESLKILFIDRPARMYFISKRVYFVQLVKSVPMLRIKGERRGEEERESDKRERERVKEEEWDKCLQLSKRDTGSNKMFFSLFFGAQMLDTGPTFLSLTAIAFLLKMKLLLLR